MSRAKESPEAHEIVNTRLGDIPGERKPSRTITRN
jgi:hypothetical protein